MQSVSTFALEFGGCNKHSQLLAVWPLTKISVVKGLRMGARLLPLPVTQNTILFEDLHEAYNFLSTFVIVKL